MITFIVLLSLASFFVWAMKHGMNEKGEKRKLERKSVSGMMLTLLLGSLLFSAIISVEGETETHDLEVSLETPTLKAPHHLSSNSSATLNATVVNKGNVTESNVNLQLLINGTKVLDSTALKLLPNATFWSAYLWAPDDGIWNLTVYAPPATGEDNVMNNVASKLVNVSIDEPPIVNFTYSHPPLLPGPIMNEVVTFNASLSFDPDWGNITTYSWNFNGTIMPPETDPITNYTFTEHGNATVTLTLYDTEDKNNSTSESLRVYAPPVADFNVSGLYYVGYILTFNASSPRSYDPDGYILNYTWDFDDGNVTTVSYPVITHIYNKYWTYLVKLIVTDNDTLTSPPQTRWLSIGSGYPKADFRITSPRPLPSPYYVNETLTFDASKSEPDGLPITDYLWDFGDGTNGTGKVINHTFTSPNNYNVNLTVIDDKGLTDSVAKAVIVKLKVYMKVEPTPIASNPSNTLSINITIANVEDLKSFEFKLSWPKNWLPPSYYLLEYNAAVEGGFIGPQRYPNGTERWKRNFLTIIETDDERLVFANYTFTSVVSKAERSGSGTLLTIKLLVKSSGNATLDLKETRLLNSTGSSIDHSVEDGNFYTKRPVAQFTWSPESPVVNGNVTFDASSSYDPDESYDPTPGLFKNYTWDFGDGSPIAHGMIFTYSYNASANYNVTLTVVDDDDETWLTWASVWIASGRDVAVIDVKPYANETAGILPINVTVKNEGDVTETFNVTLYYSNMTGNYTIKTQTVLNLAPGSEEMYTFSWDIHYVTKDNYTIFARASNVTDETDLLDNELWDGTVRVYLQGDVNRDNRTNILDAIKLAGAFGSRLGDPKWDPRADLNHDNVVNVLDCIILARNFGRQDP